jgi:hypothetical protein
LNALQQRLFVRLALLDLCASAGIGLLRFTGRIAPEPFGAFVNLHLILLMSIAVVVLVRRGAPRGFVALTLGLLLGDLGFAYAEFSGHHHGVAALAAEVLWVPLRIGILVQVMAWARPGTVRPTQQLRRGVAAAGLLIPAILYFAVLPLMEAGNPLSALVAGLTVLPLVAIAWAWPTLRCGTAARPCWAALGFATYLSTELVRYSLEASGVGDWLVLFEVGYFAAYLGLIAAALALSGEPTQANQPGSRP